MDSTEFAQITVRDAVEADLPVLTAIKPLAALHRDRLRYARRPDFRYLVVQWGHEVVGFACLVFRRPAAWSDADDSEHLPQVVDLTVAAAHRGRGFGSALLQAMEQETKRAGFRQLHLSVEPVENPRAHALYRRLGYQQLQPEPYHKRWEFSDSQGQKHAGEMWIVDMVKQI